MSPKQVKNMAASVRDRLLMLAHERGEDFQFILNRFGVERLLYRLSRSAYRDRFVLKGAMLFVVWSEAPHRPTVDLDLLGRGDNKAGAVQESLRAICLTKVEDDGIEFDAASVRAEEIQTDGEYNGVRLTLVGHLAKAKISLQVDVGFGDAIVPAPETIDYPTLLGLPRPRLRAYPKEAVIAEKYQSLVQLGYENSRMKDFYDLWMLARDHQFDGAVIGRAIQATFRRRKTPLPAEPPLALTTDFYGDPTKQALWAAFIRRGRLEEKPPDLKDVADFLVSFLMPPTLALVKSGRFAGSWPPGGPWNAES